MGVFDLSQTDPIPGADPLPLEPPSAPISGDSHAHLRPALVEHAASLGYTVSYEATDGCDGYCDHANRRIAVAAALPPNAQVRILIHECCHAHGADYKTYDRAACEVIVDCATHIACATIGLDVSGETIPYITGWGEADDALAAVTTVRRRHRRTRGEHRSSHLLGARKTGFVPIGNTAEEENSARALRYGSTASFRYLAAEFAARSRRLSG